jgi:hypothetical protein
MGSLKKRLRQQVEDGPGGLADLPDLIARARTKKNLPPIPGNVTVRIIRGWEVTLSCFEHPTSTDDAALVEHWHCSAKLHPPGRRSDSSDGEMLDSITIAVVSATGMPPEGKLRALPAATHDGVFHFLWHTDGTPCGVLAPN